jgi:hypothetical protein
MSARDTAGVRDAFRRGPALASRTAFAAAALAAGLIVVGTLVADPDRLRLALAATALLLAAGVGFVAPRWLLFGIVVWLAALGFVRRLVTEIAPPGEADPLLVVAPVAILVLLLVSIDGGAFRLDTALSKAVLVLTALVLLGALNPLQGSVVAGLAGLLFVLMPTLSFWVGRGLCDDQTIKVVIGIVAIMGIAAAGYGLWQTLLGFPRWDAEWIRTSGYDALDISGATRAFASFSSAQEYAYVLAIALATVLVFARRLPWLPVTICAVGLLGTALVLESSRGVIFTLVVALAVMAAAALRLPGPAVFAIAAVAVLVVTVGAGSLAPAGLRSPEQANSDPERLVAHQLDGLADPLNPESSTLGLHLELFQEGLRSSLSEPFGQGLGVVSRAGEKFGELQLSTEIDPSNVAVALGIPGLAVYLVVVVLAFWSAYRLAIKRRDALSIVALAVVTITIFQWLNGGLYAVSMLTWLVLGWIDRAAARAPVAEPLPFRSWSAR